jgi:tRNA A37 threonylcarbamoyltransferase TsaD
MVRSMVEERGGTMFAPPRAMCVDNGAMIAWTGTLAWRANRSVPIDRSAVEPRQRTDLVLTPWRTD